MNVPRDGLDRFRPLTPDEKGRIYQEIVNNCELHTATSCWAWRGVRSPKGYALKYIQGQMRTVSRFMLCYTTRESLNFPMDACHKEHCPIRWCVNSDHLEWGTHEDNCEEREATQFRFGANARRKRRAKAKGVASGQ